MLLNILAFIGLSAIMVFCAAAGYAFGPRIYRYLREGYIEAGGNPEGTLLLGIVAVSMILIYILR